MPFDDGLGSWICLHVLRTGRFVIQFERVINTDDEVHIGDTLVWGYERGGMYVSCLHLRVLRERRFVIGCVHACWTTSEEVRRGWTTNGKVRRGWTMSGKVHGNI